MIGIGIRMARLTVSRCNKRSSCLPARAKKVWPPGSGGIRLVRVARIQNCLIE